MTRPLRAARLTGLLLAPAVTVFALALLGFEFGRRDDGVAAVWFANGVLIAWLLRRPRSEWRLLLAAALAGNTGAGLAWGDPVGPAAALAACNAAEVLLVAWLFSRAFARRTAFDSLEHLGRLSLLALTGPAVSTALAGLSLALLGSPVGAEALLHRALANSFGILVLTPLLLALTGRGSLTAERPYSNSPSCSCLRLSRETSAIFLLTPLLVFAGFRVRVEQAVVLVTLVCGIALVLTRQGEGPLVLPALDPSLRTFMLQSFMATVLTLLLPISILSQERRRTAAALRAREEQYRLLADHSSDLVLRLDREGRALFVSSAARRLLGVTEAALAGEALAGRIHPEDRSRFRSVLLRASHNGEAVSCFRMRHSDGDYRWIEAHCRFVGSAANCRATLHSCEAALQGRCLPGAQAPCGSGQETESGHAPLSFEPAADDLTIIAALRDIHQRRTAELLATEASVRLRETNRLLLMAEGLASLGHWVHDPQAGDVLLSAEAAALLAVPQLTFRPADLVALIRTEDRRYLLRAVALARRYDAPAKCTVRIGAAATERTIQLRVQQRETLAGETGLFGIVSDITDKLRAEQQLVSALDEARRAAEFRSQFLATMSHEIRTPMTGVVGMIELLSDEPSPDQRRLYLDTLRRSADLLMAVLNDILDFSKVDAGRLTFAAEPFDLGALLQTTFRLFERSADARGLRLTLHAPLPGETWLRGDALRLQQVVSNLLNNAIKFSERGEVALRCSVHPRARGRQALRITVADRGIGISADVQSRLFEPFVQGPTSASAGGTGLGLAISRRLVAGMGGTISLRSSEGRGSSFTVSLILPSTDAGGLASAPVTEQEKERPLDILLAEDNTINQLLVTALLRRMGHRVTCAGDGEAALVAAAGRAFDIILMDMQMPRRNGLSTAAAIRYGTGPNAATPIIALTADAAAERRSCYEGGPIDLILSKPVDSSALRSALNAWSSPSPPVPLLGARIAPRLQSPTADQAMLDPAVLGEIRAMLGGARLDELLDLLAAELDSRPRAIREALADHALDRAAAETHSLKGAAANLGAAGVAGAARTLEQAIAAASGSGQRAGIAPALRVLGQAVSDTQHALAALPRFLPPVALGA